MAGLFEYIKANASPNICSHHIHAVMTLYANGDATKPRLVTLLENATGVEITGQTADDLSQLAYNVVTGTEAEQTAELLRQHAIIMAVEMDTADGGNTLVTESIVRNRLNMPLS